jgi:hypothetical protein
MKFKEDTYRAKKGCLALSVLQVKGRKAEGEGDMQVQVIRIGRCSLCDGATGLV